MNNKINFFELSKLIKMDNNISVNVKILGTNPDTFKNNWEGTYDMNDKSLTIEAKIGQLIITLDCYGNLFVRNQFNLLCDAKKLVYESSVFSPVTNVWTGLKNYRLSTYLNKCKIIEVEQVIAPNDPITLNDVVMNISEIATYFNKILN